MYDCMLAHLGIPHHTSGANLRTPRLKLRFDEDDKLGAFVRLEHSHDGGEDFQDGDKREVKANDINLHIQKEWWGSALSRGGIKQASRSTGVWYKEGNRVLCGCASRAACTATGC